MLVIKINLIFCLITVCTTKNDTNIVILNKLNFVTNGVPTSQVSTFQNHSETISDPKENKNWLKENLTQIQIVNNSRYSNNNGSLLHTASVIDKPGGRLQSSVIKKDLSADKTKLNSRSDQISKTTSKTISVLTGLNSTFNILKNATNEKSKTQKFEFDSQKIKVRERNNLTEDTQNNVSIKNVTDTDRLTQQLIDKIKDILRIEKIEKKMPRRFYVPVSEFILDPGFIPQDLRKRVDLVRDGLPLIDTRGLDFDHGI